MAKTKKKSSKSSKLSFLSKFKQPKMAILAVFVLGFGAFGVYKLAFSSAMVNDSVRISGCTISGTIGSTRPHPSYYVKAVAGGYARGQDSTLSQGSKYNISTYSMGISKVKAGAIVSVRLYTGGSSFRDIGSVKAPRTC